MPTLTASDLGLIDRRQAVRIVRDDMVENTGEPMTLDVADCIFDQQCEAFYQVYAGAGADYAVRHDTVAARYLAAKWTGDDRKQLRAALAAL